MGGKIKLIVAATIIMSALWSFGLTSAQTTPAPQNGHRLLPPVRMYRFSQTIEQAARAIRHQQMDRNSGITHLILPVYLHAGNGESQVPIYLSLYVAHEPGQPNNFVSYLYIVAVYESNNDNTSYNATHPLAYEEPQNSVSYPSDAPSFDLTEGMSHDQVISNLRRVQTRNNTVVRLALSIVESIRFFSVRRAVQERLYNSDRTINFGPLYPRIHQWRDLSIRGADLVGGMLNSTLLSLDPLVTNPSSGQNFDIRDDFMDVSVPHRRVQNQTNLQALANFIRNHNCGDGSLRRKRQTGETCGLIPVKYLIGRSYPVAKDPLRVITDIDVDQCEEECFGTTECTFYHWVDYICRLKTGKIMSRELIRTNNMQETLGIRIDVPPKVIDSVRLIWNYAVIPNINAEQCWKRCAVEEQCIASFIFLHFGCHLYNRDMGYAREKGFQASFYPNAFNVRARKIEGLRLDGPFKTIPNSVDEFCWYDCVLNADCVASMTINGACQLFDRNYQIKRERGYTAWIAAGHPLNSVQYTGLGLTGQKVKELSGVNTLNDCWNECSIVPDCVATMYMNRVCSMFDKNFGRSREPNAIASVAFGLAPEAVTYPSLRLYNQYERDETITDAGACWQQCLLRPDCVASFIFETNGCHFYNRSLGYLRQDGYSSQVSSAFLPPATTYSSLRLFNQYERKADINDAGACWQECLKQSQCVASFIFENQGCHLYNRDLGYMRQDGHASQIAVNFELTLTTFQNIRLHGHFERIEGLNNVMSCWKQCLLRSQCVASSIFENGCNFYNQSLRYTREGGFSSQVMPNFKLQPRTYQSIRLYNQYARNEAISNPDDCWQECLKQSQCVASFIFENQGCHFYNNSLGYMRQQGYSSQIAFGFKLPPTKLHNLSLDPVHLSQTSSAGNIVDCWSSCLDQNNCVAITFSNGVCQAYRQCVGVLRTPSVESYVIRKDDVSMRPYVYSNIRLVDEYKRIDGVPDERDCLQQCILEARCIGSSFSRGSCFFHDSNKYVKDPERSANMLNSHYFPDLWKFQTNYRLFNDYKSLEWPMTVNDHITCWNECFFDPRCIVAMRMHFGLFGGSRCLLYDKNARKGWIDAGATVISSNGFDVSTLPS